jgi:putative ABC transport system ATP-binding protein
MNFLKRNNILKKIFVLILFQTSILFAFAENERSEAELFSGGQRQALTLLMTVMSKPDLLLLDEHTAALDPRNAEAIMKLTLRFAKDYNLTVMMITHNNMAHALEYGNRLLMMDSGGIILDIDAREKAKLSAADIVQRFRDIKKQELANDEMLLA